MLMRVEEWEELKGMALFFYKSKFGRKIWEIKQISLYYWEAVSMRQEWTIVDQKPNQP